MVTVPTAIGTDHARIEAALRGHAALYLGGMGSRRQNFYNALAVRMGYEQEAQQVQELYLDRRYREAAAAVPDGFLATTCLPGDRARLIDRLQAYADVGIGTLAIAPMGAPAPERLAAVRELAEAHAAAGLAR